MSKYTDEDLRNIDQKIEWFTERLSVLRLERQMSQMTFGTLITQGDPYYMERIYVGHLCKLRHEREFISTSLIRSKDKD